MADYRIGIDSGGTKTRGILCGEGLETVRAVVGNTNHHACGLENAARQLHRLVSTLCDQAGVSADRLSVCFAGAGIDGPDDRQMVLRLLEDMGCTGRKLVCSDGVAALVGANGALNGGVLVCGTGSIAYGYDSRQGCLARVGGWGYKIDDLGSGYYIGAQGLRAVFEAYDGRADCTRLTERVLEFWNVRDVPALLDYLYLPECTPDRIAQLSHCILSLAGQDAAARSIQQSAIEELVRLVSTLCCKIAQSSFSLGLCGGVLANATEFRHDLMDRLSQVCPEVRPHLPVFPAEEGALQVLELPEELIRSIV